MSQNKSRAASLRHTLIVALFSIGTLFFFFPIADAGTGGYMTAVPMFCRLVLAAAVFPFLAGRAGQHMAQTGAWLYSSGDSKLERPGAVILGSVAGPICFVPLVASLSANQLLAAVGQPGSLVLRVVLVVLLVAAAYAVAERRELSRVALAGMLAAVAAGIAAFVVLLGSGAAKRILKAISPFFLRLHPRSCRTQENREKESPSGRTARLCRLPQAFFSPPLASPLWPLRRIAARTEQAVLSLKFSSPA